MGIGIGELTSKELCVVCNGENGDEPADHVELGKLAVGERENGNKLTHDLHPVVHGGPYWSGDGGHHRSEI